MPPENNNNINNTSKRSYVSNMESLRTSGMQALSEFNGDWLEIIPSIDVEGLPTALARLLAFTGAVYIQNGHIPKRPQPKRPQTKTATD